MLEEKIQTGAVIATTNASLGVGAYLASERRIPFNEQGIFRRYKELDN